MRKCEFIFTSGFNDLDLDLAAYAIFWKNIIVQLHDYLTHPRSKTIKRIDDRRHETRLRLSETCANDLDVKSLKQWGRKAAAHDP
jgi:hypothetical protein